MRPALLAGAGESCGFYGAGGVPDANETITVLSSTAARAGAKIGSQWLAGNATPGTETRGNTRQCTEGER
ncbi:hypothetical protein SAMN05216345_108154 [Cupriavidus sp. YR651]|nr:hypothetical protein SAMN05216345_108154 [Cupriavidus sp. YR651]